MLLTCDRGRFLSIAQTSDCIEVAIHNGSAAVRTTSVMLLTAVLCDCGKYISGLGCAVQSCCFASLIIPTTSRGMLLSSGRLIRFPIGSSVGHAVRASDS